MAYLDIGMKKYLDGEDIEQGIVADIIPADRSSQRRQNVVIPIGENGNTTRVEVHPGSYLVQATLPSGSMMTKQIDVQDDGAIQVIFEADPSPHEQLSWQHLSKHRQVFEGYAKNASVQPFPTPFRHESPLQLLERPPVPWTWETLRGLLSGSAPHRPTIEKVAEALGASECGELKALFRPSAEANTYLLDSVPDMHVSRVSPRPLYYVAVERGESVVDVVSLPLPWMTAGWGRSSRSYGCARLDLAVPPHAADPVAATIRDARFGTMLGYIGNGAPQMAARFFGDDAFKMLMGKLQNPFAAIAGAYVLIETEASVEQGKDWHFWIDNLANWFPWLPDGAVLAAWHRLRRGDDPKTVADALSWLRRALERGIPVFAPVLNCLNDALTMIVDDPDLDSGDLSGAAQMVSRIARRTSPRQPFTIIRFGELNYRGSS